MRILLCGVIAALTMTARAEADQTATTGSRVQVLVTTYLSTGEVRTRSSGDVTLSTGTTTSVFAHSGPTLCESVTPSVAGRAPADRPALEAQLRAAQLRYTADHPEVRRLQAQLAALENSPPAAAGFGWRLDLRALPQSDGTVGIEATWLRLWENGQRLTNGLTSTYTLKLKGSGRLLLDRLPAPAGSNSCGAIGIGLEIAVDPARATVVETEIWLVRRQPDGAETSEKQVVRSATGTPGSFIFPKGILGADLTGQVVPADHDGTLELLLTVGRIVGGGYLAFDARFDGRMEYLGRQARVSGSVDSGNAGTQARLKIRPDSPTEVIELPVTGLMMSPDKQGTAGQPGFSLRLRSRKID